MDCTTRLVMLLHFVLCSDNQSWMLRWESVSGQARKWQIKPFWWQNWEYIGKMSAGGSREGKGAPEPESSLLEEGCRISGAGDGYCQPQLGRDTSHLTEYPISSWVKGFVFSMALSGSVASASCQTQCALDKTEKHWVFSSSSKGCCC